MQLPQVRDLGVSASVYGTGFISAIALMSSHSVDLYAAWNDLYSGVKLIVGAWALAGPILLGALTLIFSRTGQKVKDVVADPAGAAVAAEALPVTPATVAVADALKKAP